MMQPLSSATVAFSSPAGCAATTGGLKKRSGSRGSIASMSRSRLGRTLRASFANGDRWYVRSAENAAFRRQRLANMARSASERSRHERGRSGRPCTMARAPSMMRPYGTPEGHAVSQARHCRQRSKCCTTFGVASMRPSESARASAMRPRGDSVSRLVIT